MTNSNFFKLFLSLFWILISELYIAQTNVVKKELLTCSDSIVKRYNLNVDTIISFAKTFLGTPYHYGGSSPSGFDCSGFISYVFGNFGFRLSRSSSALAEFGEIIAFSDIQPGDLMFFKGRNANSSRVGHVAMVIEVAPNKLKFIHSASGGVKIDEYQGSKYYTQRYIKAKRIDYGGK